MRASARVEVAHHRGGDVLVDVRSEPPLTVRVTPGRVLVVGSAAAPVGGDELALDLVVGPGSRLSAGTVAATMAWPGPTGARSTLTLRAVVGAGGHLEWTPEPLVAVAGCRHRAETVVDLAAGATAWLVEEVALGRCREPSGDLELAWTVRRDGAPILRHEEHLGPAAPGWGSAAISGGHRHLVAAVAVGPRASPDGSATVVTPDVAAARLCIAPEIAVVLIAATDRRQATDALARWRPPAPESRPTPRPP